MSLKEVNSLNVTLKHSRLSVSIKLSQVYRSIVNINIIVKQSVSQQIHVTKYACYIGHQSDTQIPWKQDLTIIRTYLKAYIRIEFADPICFFHVG